ncbi:MAG: energy transducer TonB [Thermoanaerobaculia bacterium]
MPHRNVRALSIFACTLLAAAAATTATGQDKGAVRTKFESAIYPQDPDKKDIQGNVLLIGRIDTNGNVSDIHVVAATRKEFVPPAIDSVRTWKFTPAMRNGKPIEIPLNAGVRFRLTGGGRGLIPRPILGDLAVFPADAAGAKTAPDGFPIWKGKDPALRAEAQLDVPPSEQPRTMTVKVEAVSPSGRRIPVFQPPLAVPALASEVSFPVVAQIGTDWEEGVWILRFSVDGTNAGGGQFWLAKDPATFPFALPAL